MTTRKASPSLADRLAGRQPRRATVPIEVTDPGDEVRTWAVYARRALASVRAQHAAGLVTDEQLAAAVSDADQARDALAGHCLMVELQAAPPDAWEALTAEHLTDDGADVGPGALPAMLALCAVDESLRDPQWWTEQLAVWPFGDRESLRAAVLDVNAWSPARALGKG